MIYASAKIQLNDLSKTQEESLRQLSGLSRDLYNLCSAVVSEHYQQHREVLEYKSLKAKIASTPEYRALGGYYYQTLLTAIADFRKYISTSCYALNKSDRTLRVKNLDNFSPPVPQVKPRMIEVKSPQTEDGRLLLWATQHTPAMKIPLPENYRDKNIISICIHPLHHSRYWELAITYTQSEVAHPNLDRSKALGIDLGVTNFATCLSTEGDSFIIDGRYLKNLWQGYCKYRAKLWHSGSRGNTKRLCSLYNKTHHRSLDYVRKTAAYIIRYCIDHDLGTLVLGWGIHFQQGNIGKNNQLYALLPFAKLKHALEYQCRKHGVRFVVVDECYTSQASAYDLDPMPMHVTPTPQTFSGKRIRRGLYMPADGTPLISADVNGAANILRKGKFTPQFLLRRERRGIASPQRINPLK